MGRPNMDKILTNITKEGLSKDEVKKACIELANIAIEMRKKSYAPYSHFAVGAALIAADGTVITGCNIENAAYPVGICAERTAFSKAVSEGYTKFKALAIAGAPDSVEGSDFCPPCGMCRQAMREFCDSDFPVVLVKKGENEEPQIKIMTLEELLPESFGPDNL